MRQYMQQRGLCLVAITGYLTVSSATKPDKSKISLCSSDIAGRQRQKAAEYIDVHPQKLDYLENRGKRVFSPLVGTKEKEKDTVVKSMRQQLATRRGGRLDCAIWTAIFTEREIKAAEGEPTTTTTNKIENH